MVITLGGSRKQLYRKQIVFEPSQYNLPGNSWPVILSAFDDQTLVQTKRSLETLERVPYGAIRSLNVFECTLNSSLLHICAYCVAKRCGIV